MPQVSFTDLVAGVKSGDHLISFPTDTVPALAARPDRADLIFAAKQRSLDKPLILMAAEASDLWPFVTGSPEAWAIWQPVTAQYWPGALTLVLPASDRVPPAMNPTNPTTIGIRVPNHDLARAILAQTGPLATTSANLSGQPALQTLPEIEAQFPAVLTLPASELNEFLHSEAASGSSQQPSTVARWTGQGWEILRQGAIKLDP